MSHAIARVYVDANVFIYAVDGAPHFKSQAQQLIASFESDAISSPVSLRWGNVFVVLCAAKIG